MMNIGLKALAFVGFLALLAIGGCAWTEGAFDDVGERVYEGLQGRGQIVPLESSTGSFSPMSQ